MIFSNKLQGVGFNLRLEYIDEMLKKKPKVQYLEIIADNWLSDGPHHRKLEILRKDYDILFHCVGMNIAGTDALNFDYLKKIKKLKDLYEPLHISDHLCFQAHNNIHHHDLLPFPLNKESYCNVRSRVNRIQEVLNENILIENLSYYVEFIDSDMTESLFLNSISNECGSKVLLDLNNIMVNEKNLSHNKEAYIRDISVKNIGELHFASADKVDDVYIDSHCGDVEEELLNFANKTLKGLDVPMIYERDTNLPGVKSSFNNIKKIHREMVKH